MWIVTAFTASGCEFFEELKSAETAEAAATDASEDTDPADTEGDDACSFPADDLCSDQDRLHSCDPNTGQATIWDCVAHCGDYVNFTCIDAGDGRHACWCVEPGLQKVLSCTELESCLVECNGAADTGCADLCFARTNTSTVRMFGALVLCAQASCHATCIADRSACSPCIERALAQGTGGCTLERSVCDADRNDDPEWY